MMSSLIQKRHSMKARPSCTSEISNFDDSVTSAQVPLSVPGPHCNQIRPEPVIEPQAPINYMKQRENSILSAYTESTTRRLSNINDIFVKKRNSVTEEMTDRLNSKLTQKINAIRLIKKQALFEIEIRPDDDLSSWLHSMKQLEALSRKDKIFLNQIDHIQAIDAQIDTTTSVQTEASATSAALFEQDTFPRGTAHFSTISLNGTEENLMFIGSFDGAVHVGDLTTNRVVKTFAGAKEHFPTCIKSSLDDRTFFCGYSDSSVRWYDCRLKVPVAVDSTSTQTLDPIIRLDSCRDSILKASSRALHFLDLRSNFACYHATLAKPDEACFSNIFFLSGPGQALLLQAPCDQVSKSSLMLINERQTPLVIADMNEPGFNVIDIVKAAKPQEVAILNLENAEVGPRSSILIYSLKDLAGYGSRAIKEIDEIRLDSHEYYHLSLTSLENRLILRSKSNAELPSNLISTIKDIRERVFRRV